MLAQPQHIAIVMDGNGRWAEKRKRPRSMGHQAGVRALRKTAEHCARIGIGTLTVFAFSSENWNRPKREVSRLMDLFMRSLEKEVDSLHKNGVRVRFLGDRTPFSPDLRQAMGDAEQLTILNKGLIFNVAVNYGGRWDILQATRKLAGLAASGEVDPDSIDQDLFAAAISTFPCPDPDLFIRTGGEKRISNFLLWQLAYTELFFTQTLWPDFSVTELDDAIETFRKRERRFGKTGKQVREDNHA